MSVRNIHIKSFKLIYLTLMAFISLNSDLSAAQPILLKNADVIHGVTFDNLQVRNFTGNVIFEQGNILITCDTAIQYIEEIELI